VTAAWVALAGVVAVALLAFRVRVWVRSCRAEREKAWLWALYLAPDYQREEHPNA
jgi:hypothetical protein